MNISIVKEPTVDYLREVRAGVFVEYHVNKGRTLQFAVYRRYRIGTLDHIAVVASRRSPEEKRGDTVFNFVMWPGDYLVWDLPAEGDVTITRVRDYHNFSTLFWYSRGGNSWVTNFSSNKDGGYKVITTRSELIGNGQPVSSTEVPSELPAEASTHLEVFILGFNRLSQLTEVAVCIRQGRFTEVRCYTMSQGEYLTWQSIRNRVTVRKTKESSDKTLYWSKQ